jgi:hypothetical protein
MKARICRSTPAAESSRGVNGLMGALMREGATESGLWPYRPPWRICRATFPPSACTASVTTRWARAAPRLASRAPNGLSHPSTLGANPPVTMSPAPPRARSAR